MILYLNKNHNIDNILCIDNGKVMLYMIYEYYTHRYLAFQKLNIYEYF